MYGVALLYKEYLNLQNPPPSLFTSGPTNNPFFYSLNSLSLFTV